LNQLKIRQRLNLIGCPNHPTARQAEFLLLDCEEALFGGAAGPGKTDALLMWLAAGVQIPGYSAIIFRRTFPQLMTGNESVWAKSKRLYEPMGGSWQAGLKQWTWKSGAVVRLSHLQHERDCDDHQGPSYHRVAFDESTQFTEYQWRYLYARVRSAPNYPISLGIRGASNPGGVGHAFFKSRFVSEEAVDTLSAYSWRDPSPPNLCFWRDGRAFVPGRLADNPFIDRAAYAKRLSHLTGATRARMLNGDWSVVEGAILDAEHFRYYEQTDESLIGYDKYDRPVTPVKIDQCQRFLTIDTANTKDRNAEAKGSRPASYHACGVWDYHPIADFLYLRHVWRDRVEFPDLCQQIDKIATYWRPGDVYIEDATMGRALASMLQRDQIERRINCQVQLASPQNKVETGAGGRQGKVERSTAFQIRLSKHRVFFPKFESQWLPDYENELVSWSGLDADMADQVDISSYAARVAEGLTGYPSRQVIHNDPWVRDEELTNDRLTRGIRLL
jgi:phage terminase large subunit-like protein